MSLFDDLRKKHTPEEMQTLMDILGDDFDDDLVPRSRLNKVIKQRNDLKKQVNSTTQVEDPDDDDDDDDNNSNSGDGGSATYTEKEVKKLLKAEREKAETGIKQVEVKYAALSKLREANAVDADLVFGLLDASKLSLNDKGELQGLEEAGLKTIQESKKFLFKEPDTDPSSNVPPGTGKNAGGKSKNNTDAVDTAIANVFAGYGLTQSENE